MKVVNLKKDKFDLYIGRENITYGFYQSKWHNPFRRVDYPNQDVLELYEHHLRNSPLYDQLEELDGLTLGCWCKPSACHGDVLIRLLNEKKLNSVF